MISPHGTNIPDSIDSSGIASLKKGGGGGYGISFSGGGLEPEQIPGVVYAVVHGILFLCAIGALWRPTRSYIHAFALATAFVALVNSALAARFYGGSYEPNLAVASGVFSFLLNEVMLVTLVAACAEAARRSARHAGIPAKGRKAILVSIAGYVLAFIACILLAPIFIIPIAEYTFTYARNGSLIREGGINAGHAGARSVYLIVLFAGWILSIVIYVWGLKMGGMPARFKWVVPVCLAMFGSVWLYFVVVSAVVLAETDVDLFYAYWTWCQLSIVAFLVVLIFFFKGTRMDNLNTTAPSLQDAYKVETPNEQPLMMGGTAPVSNLNYGSPAAAPPHSPPGQQPYSPVPHQAYSPAPQQQPYTTPYTPPPQQTYSPPPQQGFNTSPTYHDQAYGGALPQTPPPVPPHDQRPMSMQSNHSQPPGPISADTPIWIQPPGQAGYWATYSSLGQGGAPPPPGHA